MSPRTAASFAVRGQRTPIVPAAILFDLAIPAPALLDRRAALPPAWRARSSPPAALAARSAIPSAGQAACQGQPAQGVKALCSLVFRDRRTAGDGRRARRGQAARGSLVRPDCRRSMRPPNWRWPARSTSSRRRRRRRSTPRMSPAMQRDVRSQQPARTRSDRHRRRHRRAAPGRNAPAGALPLMAQDGRWRGRSAPAHAHAVRTATPCSRCLSRRRRTGRCARRLSRHSAISAAADLPVARDHDAR